MDILIVVCVVISSVLLCWCFSLILRLISDIIARRSNKLRAEYQRYHLRNACIAIAITFVSSVGFGWSAVQLYASHGDLVNDGHVVLAVSFCLVVFATLLGIWAFIGDRSRGRLRCPHCWYDMAGLDTSRCPECGEDVKSSKHLHKSRRVKWPIVPVVLFLSFATYGFISAPHVDDTDYFALVPTWLLMLGWEHLPDEWIFESWTTNNSSLSDRLGEGYSDNPWMSDVRSRAFGEKLSKGLLTDSTKRWNPRRLILIDRTRFLLTHNRVDGGDDQWIGPPIDASELLRLSTQDIIAAFQAATPSQEQVRIRSVEISRGRFGFYYDSPYGIAKDWILSGLVNATPYAPEEAFAESNYYHRNDEYWDQILNELNESTKEILTEFHQELLSPTIQGMLNSGSSTDQKNATSLLLDAGLIENPPDP